MKRVVINYCMKSIEKNNKYDEIKLQEIKYGLEAIYLNISKFIVYFTINAILGTFLEGIIFLILYIPLRSFSFGFHAKNSLTCWILSAIGFVIIPYISTIVTFNFISKIIIIIYSLTIYLLFSPADTPARPIINKEYRLKLKKYTLITVMIYCILIILIELNITNLIILALIYQSIMITPYFYKIFKVSYNNYLSYGLN